MVAPLDPHVQQAIDAAREAHADWSRLPWEERASVFLRAAELHDVSAAAPVFVVNILESAQEALHQSATWLRGHPEFRIHPVLAEHGIVSEIELISGATSTITSPSGLMCGVTLRMMPMSR